MERSALADRLWFNRFANALLPRGVSRVNAAMLWEDPEMRERYIARPFGKKGEVGR